jgi:hypothetical protein
MTTLTEITQRNHRRVVQIGAAAVPPMALLAAVHGIALAVRAGASGRVLLSEGPEWAATLDESLRKRLEGQLNSNMSRWYLGVDAEEDLLWSTTHGQLAALLRRDSIQHHLLQLCGFYGELLAQRLESVALIRNTLAHSRAISDDSISILQGDLYVIRTAVDRFKTKTLYALADIVSMDDDVPDDLFDFLFVFEDLQQTIQGQQLFVDANDDFVSLVRLPVPPWELPWPDGNKLRIHLGPVAHLIVCLLVNKTGHEIQIVMPRALRLDNKLNVLKRFMTTAVLEDCWTDTPLEKQHPTSSCWPRLWFYENQRAKS